MNESHETPSNTPKTDAFIAGHTLRLPAHVSDEARLEIAKALRPWMRAHAEFTRGLEMELDYARRKRDKLLAECDFAKEDFTLKLAGKTDLRQCLAAAETCLREVRRLISSIGDHGSASKQAIALIDALQAGKEPR